MTANATLPTKPLVLITGAAGDVGGSLAGALGNDYTVVGMDRPGTEASIPLIAFDLASDEDVARAFRELRERYGARIASVIHLAAYFDFTGEQHPLYEKVNVQGTRRLLAALQDFDVGQFVYSGTMLVHAPCRPGERIDESAPIAPKWAYPKSKAAAEEVIRTEHGRIPYVLLHMAGLYDERGAVPTLAHQIARIYERDFKSHLYAGDLRAGQSMLHKEDMIDAFRRVVDRRAELPPDAVILIGEPDAPGYEALQDQIGELIHGEDWTTLDVPKPLAAAGAALQEKLEPVVPDALDQGEKPFIRPFMVAMADDHYALDISRARELLGWTPQHRLVDVLPSIVEALKRDPQGWYKSHKIPPPPWLESAQERGMDAEDVRVRHETGYRDAHRRNVWAHFANAGLGLWLLTTPPVIGVASQWMAISDVIAGIALFALSLLSLSWRIPWARWGAAAIGLWVASAPILLWAPTAAGYLNDTLVGMLIIAFAVALPPEPGVSPIAATSGPAQPVGWSYNPSDWTQRLPIIVLAIVGLEISRYLAAYQLGHIDALWDPFFAGGPDPKNGTEEIVTSSVSQAWPVPDAGVGALTYALEILTGVIGSRARWRTMPWLVLLFGLMVAPLGVVSIFFIVIQPIWIGTWCTLCLVGAAAMLVQIPYSLDELIAVVQFLRRRMRAGRPLLRVFLFGDTDEGATAHPVHEFDRAPREVLRDMVAGGVNLPWNLALCALIGAWLMFTRLTLGAEGSMANADHIVGALVLTVVSIAAAEVARAARFLLVPLGIALLITPFAYDTSTAQLVASIVAGVALIALSIRRGAVRGKYGSWDRLVV